jgi:histidinol-phosphate aminotransferase
MRARAAIADLVPYEPGKPALEVQRAGGLARVVKLASNEGQFGPLPAAVEAIARAVPALNRYPERARELCERLAARHGVTVDRVAVGNGADSLVGLLSLAFLDAGDEALTAWPSFVTYRLAAVRMGARPVLVPLSDGAADPAALLAAVTDRTRVVFVANPNNPTGDMLPRPALAAFLDALPERVLAVVDEAYHEYVTADGYPDAIAEHGGRPNVAVLRTFSKIYGLAGLRIGYLVGPPAAVAAVRKVQNAFDTSELGHVAALASLDAPPAELARRRADTAAGREAIAAALAAAGFEPRPSVANFVYADVGDGRALADRLEREGVIVRPLAPFGAPEAIRVTVGTPAEIERFAAALAGALERA